MANSCCLWQQRLLYPKTTTFSLRTSRCRTVHSRLVLRCIRTVSVATHRNCIRPHWHTGNTVAFGNSRLAAIFTSQRKFLGYSTPVWPLIGASCVPRHLLSPLGGTLASSGLHTGNVALREEKEDTRPKSKGGEQAHGSVLMEMIKSQDQQPKQLTVGAKVVQAGKDISYLVVIIAGFAVAGFLFWSVGSEFFSQSSPSVVYSRALKRVKADPRVIEVLGEPISGHGAPSGRGRRRDVLHQEYIVDDVTYMRVKFYVDGSKRKGTVHVDLKKNDRGKYECRFLFVELKGYPPVTIVLEDNRRCGREYR